VGSMQQELKALQVGKLFIFSISRWIDALISQFVYHFHG
jgi:hypothetical protein